MDVGAAFDEAGVDHQLAVQRDIGRDALDHHFRQRDLHAADRLFARGAVSDDLADHRIVVRRYIVTGIGVRINADAGAARRVPGGDAARRRRELERVLGVDAALDGVAGQHHVALAEAQLLAVGDADLFLHDVDAGDHFGDRVFDLHAGVHLDEIELAVFIQELEGAGASSMTFWWRRCIEQSRSPSQTAFLCSSARIWISTWRGFSRYFSIYTSGLPKAVPASVLVMATALISAASVWTTRMPRPPPPPAALMMTG